MKDAPEDPPSAPIEHISTLIITAQVDVDHHVTLRSLLENALRKHIPRLRRPRDWVAPISILATILAVLATTTFEDRILSAEIWRALFFVGFAVTLVWSILEGCKAQRSPTLDEVVHSVIEESRLLARPVPLARASPDLFIPVTSWPYDFAYHFDEGTQARHPGSDIRVFSDAVCEKVSKLAIFEHPPEDSSFFSELTYHLAPGLAAGPVELRGFVGILSELADRTPPRDSTRPPNNGIRFQLTVDEVEVFRCDKYTSEWEPLAIQIPAAATLTISFRTNCLGDPHCNWAAWAESELVQAC